MVSISSTSSNTVIRAALRSIDADTKTTQNRIATGLKVASYTDNSTVWNAAQSIRTDVKLADNLKSGIAIGKGRADVATAALKTILDRLGDMKNQQSTAAAAGATTDTKAAAAAEMSGLVSQINAALSSASFQGANWLTDAGGAQTVNIGIDNGTALTTSFTTQAVNDSASSGTALNQLLSLTFDSTTAGAAGTTTKLTAAITQITSYMGSVSGFAKALDNQSDFLTTLNDIRNKAVGSLVDADLEEESAKAKTLEVRQQLAYQALSIGNNSQDNILLLFR